MKQFIIRGTLGHCLKRSGGEPLCCLFLFEGSLTGRSCGLLDGSIFVSSPSPHCIGQYVFCCSRIGLFTSNGSHYQPSLTSILNKKLAFCYILGTLITRSRSLRSISEYHTSERIATLDLIVAFFVSTKTPIFYLSRYLDLFQSYIALNIAPNEPPLVLNVQSMLATFWGSWRKQYENYSLTLY